MSSPAAFPDAGAQPIFPDEILGEIFLRLGSAADLARASAACTAFLRVARFLRRNRLLYRSPVVGFLPSEGPLSLHPRSLHHAEPPHRSAAAAISLAQLVDLTFSFLPVPDPNSWQIRDASDGRLLLASRTTAGFVDLIVCDPLHRRFAFLAAAGKEESSFRVAWVVKLEGKVAAFVFSSAVGTWRRVTSGSDVWRRHASVMLTSCRYYTHRSFCRTAGLFSDVLMLDTRRMEFSVVRIPSVQVCRQHAIVEAGEGTLGFLTLGDDVLDLYCKAWQDGDAGAEEWRHEKRIPLPNADDLRYTFSGAGSGYLLLQAIPRDRSELTSTSQQEVPKVVQYFTLEVKTLLMERLCLSNKHIDFAYLYANFPLLSLPSV